MNDEDIRAWAIAACDAAREELKGMDFEETGTNTLSAVGNLASRTIRRRVLLQTLEAHDWNLTYTARSLNVSGVPQLTRMINELELRPMQREAQRSGKGRQGGRREKATR